MSAPVITIYDSTNANIVSEWNAGSVQASVPSSTFTVNFWNNKGGTTAVSDLRNCTITVIDLNDDNATDEVPLNKWVQTNVPSVDGNSTTYTAIGGNTTHPIRANGITTSDNTISGAVNDGTAVNSTVNFCTTNFQINAPINSTPGNKTFRIRLTGYYT